MSDVKLRTLANFASEPEARALESALAAQGVSCSLNNAEFIANFWQYGNAVGGVSVQVADRDWDVAQAVVQSQPVERDDWTCSNCHATNEAAFEVCWQCGHEFNTADDLPVAESETFHTEKTAELSVDEAALERAWKASVVGLMIPFGFLNLYSSVVLLQVRLWGVPANQTWKYWTAWFLNVALLITLCLFAIGY